MNQNLISAATALVIGLAVLPQTAAAAETTRIEFILPVNICQGALPNYEGAFRKRPRGIRNEGAANAFISCALLSRNASMAKHTNIEAKFVNSTAVAKTVNCTLVDGSGIGHTPPSVNIIRSVSVPANTYSFATWTTADNGGNNYFVPAISCEIPPGVEINNINDTYLEEIGS